MTITQSSVVDAAVERLAEYPEKPWRPPGGVMRQRDYAGHLAAAFAHAPEDRVVPAQFLTTVLRAADRLDAIALEISPKGDTGTIALANDLRDLAATYTPEPESVLTLFARMRNEAKADSRADWLAQSMRRFHEKQRDA